MSRAGAHPAKEGLLAAARAVRAPAIVLFVYVTLHAIFGSLTEREGLLTPEGAVSLHVAALGAAVLVLRLVVVFVLPAVVTYRLVALLLARGSDSTARRPQPGSPGARERGVS